MGTLICGGDVNIQGRQQPAHALEGIAEVLADADRRFVNLEGPLCGSAGAGVDIPHKPNWTHSAPGMVEGLTAVGIDVVGCANNVTFPGAAVSRSIAVLDEAGIAHCGAGTDDTAAHAPAILDCAGVRTAFLSYSSICWPFGHAATTTSPGIATLRAWTTYRPDYRVLEVPGRAPTVQTTPLPEDQARLQADITGAREVSDVVIVSVHWGIAGDQLADYQIALAHTAVDAGAAAVVGHGPHSIHAVETYKGAPILYSLGNLAFDWEPMRGRHLDGLLARMSFGEKSDGIGVTDVELLPTARDESNNVRRLDGQDAQRVLHRVARLSAKTASHLTIRDDTAHLSCSLLS